jgi:hypothetical protein
MHDPIDRAVSLATGYAICSWATCETPPGKKV